MRRILLLSAVAASLLSAAPAGAQPARSPAPANGVVALPLPVAPAALPALPAPAVIATSPAPPAIAAPLTPEQAARVLDILKDDKKRAELIGTLEAIGKALPAAVPAADKTLPIPLAPDSLGAELLVELSGWLTRVSGEVVAAASMATSVPSLWAWMMTMATDPLARASLLDMGWRLLIVVGFAAAAFIGTRHLLRRPHAALAGLAPVEPGVVLPPAGDRAEPAATVTASTVLQIPTIGIWLRRLPLALAALLLDLLVVLCFALVGHLLVASSIGSTRIVRLVLLAVVNAFVGYGIAMAVARALFAPRFPRLRLVPASDAGAANAIVWLRRIVAVSVCGYAIAEAGLLLGLSDAAHQGVLKLVGFVVSLLIALIALANRGPLGALITPTPAAKGPFALARRRFAGIWHFIVAFYVMALWLVWALDIPNGFERLVRFFIATALVMAAGRLGAAALNRTFDRWIAGRQSRISRGAGLDSRLSRYYPVARGALNGVFVIVIAVVLLQAWGLGSLGWFVGDGVGARLLSAVLTFALTVLGGLLLWEAMNAMIERHLARLATESQLARSARLRTLLPMIRTSLLIVILVIISFTLLSEIGVNIAPLLAGAGVIGLAIGFGSQKLVQDIITGMFLLLENTMQVGDVIELAGRSGVVENLSVRTIRLRDLDGSVHIIPFSAVTTVTNMTRDFGYAVVDVTMGQEQEPDRIADVLRDLIKEMRSEPRWRAAIRDELEVLGVERFVDQGWVMRARIRTQPNDRWAVGREFNRRVKYRFDQLSIDRLVPSYRVVGHLPGVPAAPAQGGGA